MLDGGHISVPFGFIKSSFNILYSFVTKPKETWYIYKNRFFGLWRYYIQKEKKYNFIVDKRLSHHTIYPDGTLITHTKYSVFMLDNGHFEIDKYYISENNELNENGSRKVDMSQCPDIYLTLDENVKENRFRNFLLIVELVSPSATGSRFISKIIRKKSNEKELHYYIKYTKLKKFTKFSFFVSLSVPKEFDRESKKDRLGIEPNMYGLYEFHSKVDKQCKESRLFEPILYDIHGKEQPAKHSASLFYIGNQWKLYEPKGGEIKIEDISEEKEA